MSPLLLLLSLASGLSTLIRKWYLVPVDLIWLEWYTVPSLFKCLRGAADSRR